MQSTPGPDFGFLPNKTKWWIIAKADKTESGKKVFKRNGHQHNSIEWKAQRSTAIGLREYQEEFVNEKVPDWVSEVG